MSIRALAVLKNGIPEIMGRSSSSFMSRTSKSVGKINFPNFADISLIIPRGLVRIYHSKCHTCVVQL